MINFNYDKFLENLKISSGDIVDVSSDLMSIMLYCKKNKLSFSPDILIDKIKEKVEPDGTIMIRAFSWDFCKGIPFDINKTPSRSGSLGNFALKRKDFSRTKHPLYSWVVSGKYASDLLSNDSICCFGSNSIFHFLYSKNAKQINLGNINHSSLTILHYAETTFGVPYRKEKFFEGDYISFNNQKERKKYSMYVRPYNIEITTEPLESNNTQNILIKKGLKHKSIFDSKLETITYDLHGVVDFMLNDFKNNDGKNIIKINRLIGINECLIDYDNAIYYKNQ